jgi:hypothetical protein
MLAAASRHRTGQYRDEGGAGEGRVKFEPHAGILKGLVVPGDPDLEWARGHRMVVLFRISFDRQNVLEASWKFSVIETL